MTSALSAVVSWPLPLLLTLRTSASLHSASAGSGLPVVVGTVAGEIVVVAAAEA